MHMCIYLIITDGMMVDITCYVLSSGLVRSGRVRSAHCSLPHRGLHHHHRPRRLPFDCPGPLSWQADPPHIPAVSTSDPSPHARDHRGTAETYTLFHRTRLSGPWVRYPREYRAIHWPTVGIRRRKKAHIEAKKLGDLY
jgi:hypothetical protein